MTFTKTLLTALVTSTLVGCGGSDDKPVETPKPEVEQPETLPPTDLVPPSVIPPIDIIPGKPLPTKPCDDDDCDVDGEMDDLLPPLPLDPPVIVPPTDIIPPLDPPTTNCGPNGECLEDNFLPSKVAIDDPLCQGRVTNVPDGQFFYCSAYNEDDALKGYFSEFGHSIDKATCEADIKRAHDDGYYTNSQCFEGEFIQKEYNVDSLVCSEKDKEVEDGKYYYCASKETGTITDPNKIELVISGENFEQCQNNLHNQNSYPNITGSCYSGAKFDTPKFSFTDKQVKLTPDFSAQLGIESCVVDGTEYLNVDMDNYYNPISCSAIVDAGMDVRFIRQMGDNLGAVVVRPIKSNPDNKMAQAFLINTKTNVTTLIKQETIYLGGFTNPTEVEQQIQSAVGVISSELSSFILPSEPRNGTNKLINVNGMYSNGDGMVDYMDANTHKVTSVSLEGDAYSWEYHKALFTNDALLVKDRGGYTVSFDAVTGKRNDLWFDNRFNFDAVNKQGNLLSVGPQFGGSDHMPFGNFLSEYSVKGELLRTISTLEDGQYLGFSSYVGNFASNGDVAIDFRNSVLGTQKVCGPKTDNEVGYSLKFMTPSAFICTGYTPYAGGEYVKGFYTFDVTNGLTGDNRQYIEFGHAVGLKIVGIIGNDLRAKDVYGQPYIISVKDGSVLSNHQFEDVIIKK
ncbi:hypothetical protein [Photobacterium damselae]|uniref:hypothetical protein n=1 Tax=Photobacterium damselae TaxID=38293 RepID=UPI001EFE70BE|nr:hypothetical protein [Photobacterium damselae]MCG9780584.1 hypothetical protein [Photobacterium damselae]